MEEKLMALLLEVNPDLDPATISMSSDLRSDLGLDSLSSLQLLMEIEDLFQFEFADCTDLKTVGDLCDTVRAASPLACQAS